MPAFVPQLALSGLNGTNPSAALIDWIQTYNSDHWGQYPNGTPLTRLNNPFVAETNRSVMCGSFVPQPTIVPNDSCDEFPFASTYQSGAELGLTAANCGEGQMVWLTNTSQWVFLPVPGQTGPVWNPTQRCAVGHIPLSSNQSVGGSYSQLIQNNRLLDQDPFWIAFSP